MKLLLETYVKAILNEAGIKSPLDVQTFIKSYKKFILEQATDKSIYDLEMNYKYWVEDMTYDRWKNELFNENNIKIHYDEHRLETTTNFGGHTREIYKILPAEEEIKLFAKNRGWFVKRYILKDNALIVIFESYKSKRVLPSRKLYHLAPDNAISSIMKKGLLRASKTANIDYPPRVYVFADFRSAKSFLQQQRMSRMMSQIYSQMYGIDADDIVGMNFLSAGDEMILLQIDKSKLLRGTKFYKDPDMPAGLYTYSNVPPQALKVLKI